MKQIINTKEAPAPIGPYNQAVVANGVVYCSGQVAINPVDGTFVRSSPAEQTKQILANLEAVLVASGSSLNQVVKCSIFLTNLNDFQAVNKVYASVFGEKDAPARETVEVSRLPAEAEVEISCIALVE